jgi:hypothetical protein
MPDSSSATSLRSAFKFPFQSQNWFGRFLIGVGLLYASMIIPIIPAIFVYGYIVEVMRQAIKSETLALPEWKDWGQLGKDGLRSLVVGTVYLGPGLVVLIGGWVAYMVIYFSGVVMISDRSYHYASPNLAVALILGAMGILFLSMFFGSLLCMAGSIPLPAAMANFVAHDKISAAFHVREWGAIVRADKLGYFISWVVVLGLAGVVYCASMLLYFTIILCFLMYFIAIPLGFYLALVSAAVFGNFYREGASQLSVKRVEQAGKPA